MGTGIDQYIPLVYTKAVKIIAKLFRNGRSQAVRLPKEFRFEGDAVRIRKVPQGVLLEPLVTDTKKWFEKLDSFASEPFMPEGREQPAAQERETFE
jgi:antitoxin VapB